MLFESGRFTQVLLYGKTCVKRPLKIAKTNIIMTNGSLMKVEKHNRMLPFCNTFDLIFFGLGKQILVFLRVTVLDKFYCTCKFIQWGFRCYLSIIFYLRPYFTYAISTSLTNQNRWPFFQD